MGRKKSQVAVLPDPEALAESLNREHERKLLAEDPKTQRLRDVYALFQLLSIEHFSASFIEIVGRSLIMNLQLEFGDELIRFGVAIRVNVAAFSLPHSLFAALTPGSIA